MSSTIMTHRKNKNKNNNKTTTTTTKRKKKSVGQQELWENLQPNLESEIILFHLDQRSMSKVSVCVEVAPLD